MKYHHVKTTTFRLSFSNLLHKKKIVGCNCWYWSPHVFSVNSKCLNSQVGWWHPPYFGPGEKVVLPQSRASPQRCPGRNGGTDMEPDVSQWMIKKKRWRVFQTCSDSKIGSKQIKKKDPGFLWSSQSSQNVWFFFGMVNDYPHLGNPTGLAPGTAMAVWNIQEYTPQIPTKTQR